jgi:hypothetical protein
MRHAAVLAAIALTLAAPHVARACGCLSPPDPTVTPGEYAVNQSGEQIIFEVEPGWVTAHVLIRYSGNPAQFAWLVPVPEAPELSISPVSAFGLLDQATAPTVAVNLEDLCPQSPWQCHYDEPSRNGGCANAADGPTFGAGASSDAGAASSDAAGASPVTVINTQTVGDYQTVTFSASDAAAATQWLQTNGFIVNSTTSIYMESYIQANMVFVAAKLVPGAGTNAIKPLRMRYRAAYPSIPLILTAVAAQPHLTVTAFVFGNQPFRPMGDPIVAIPTDRLARDPSGRLNYPMVLARAVDDAGGNGFAIEYRGGSNPSSINRSACCAADGDLCGIGNDGQCQCPAAAFDAADCSEQGDLVQGATLLQTLATSYTNLTRITTRLSPEQMTFDPTFEPDFTPGPAPGLLANTSYSLAACASRVIDQATFGAIEARQGCAAMYCGIGAQCVTTAAGPACACAAGSVAQVFTDEDELPSVTCVPTTPPVDLRAGGTVLPDACADVTCGDGVCIDRNGIPACACDPGTAAVLDGTAAPSCAPIQVSTGTPGAQDFSQPLAALAVCTPPPPDCGDGQLENVGATIQGVDCGNSTPPEDKQWHPGYEGCGCQDTRARPPLAFMAGTLLVLALILRRRRR